MKYTSIVYDLTYFGIHKIKTAVVGADCDSGISFEISFDGGASFYTVTELNKPFSVNNSKGKIQFRINFNPVSSFDIYRIKTIGYFSNLEAGTTLYFTNKSTKKEYSTTIAENGRYSISLPRGCYEVWFNQNSNKIELLSSFNPETVVLPTKRLDKQLAVELYVKDMKFVKNAIFDVFDDESKKLIGNTIIDTDGDLSDGITSRKCRWICIGFE